MKQLATTRSAGRNAARHSERGRGPCGGGGATQTGAAVGMQDCFMLIFGSESEECGTARKILPAMAPIPQWAPRSLCMTAHRAAWGVFFSSPHLISHQRLASLIQSSSKPDSRASGRAGAWPFAHKAAAELQPRQPQPEVGMFSSWFLGGPEQQELIGAPFAAAPPGLPGRGAATRQARVLTRTVRRNGECRL